MKVANVALQQNKAIHLIPRTVDILCALLILLFLYTGLSKLIDHRLTVFNMHASPWGFISNYSVFFSWMVPIAEIAISGLLLVPVTKVIGLYLSATVMFIFTLYVAVLLSSGANLPCSCGGIIDYLSWKQHLFVNITFLLIAVSAIILTRRYKAAFHSYV